MRKYTSAEERAAKKKQKTTVRHLVLQRKYMDFRARFAQCYCTIIYRNAIVHISFFLRGTTAVEAPRRRAASARILYIYIVYVCQAMVYVRTYIVCICTHDCGAMLWSIICATFLLTKDGGT